MTCWQYVAPAIKHTYKLNRNSNNNKNNNSQQLFHANTIRWPWRRNALKANPPATHQLQHQINASVGWREGEGGVKIQAIYSFPVPSSVVLAVSILCDYCCCSCCYPSLIFVVCVDRTPTLNNLWIFPNQWISFQYIITFATLSLGCVVNFWRRANSVCYNWKTVEFSVFLPRKQK